MAGGKSDSSGNLMNRLTVPRRAVSRMNSNIINQSSYINGVVFPCMERRVALAQERFYNEIDMAVLVRVLKGIF